MIYYMSHPDVVVDPDVPVPAWPLSEQGLRRMAIAAKLSFVRRVGAIYSSDEKKALDGAHILGQASGLTPKIQPDLGENDRSSTGYLPQDQFLSHVHAFFAEPEKSVGGWESAVDAQARIVRAVKSIQNLEGAKDIVIVAHGGVGALLLTSLLGRPISMNQEQPGSAGGNWYSFDAEQWALKSGWLPFEG
jgi:broad specificity phosphatase PhoE